MEKKLSKRERKRIHYRNLSEAREKYYEARGRKKGPIAYVDPVSAAERAVLPGEKVGGSFVHEGRLS